MFALERGVLWLPRVCCQPFVDALYGPHSGTESRLFDEARNILDL